jgi:hypothetical protein
MLTAQLLPSNAVKAAAATAGLAVVRDQQTVMIEVGAGLYTFIAVTLALVGVYLARLVTIDAENKKLGRIQTLRETGPLTWIGVLIVGPLIWHFKIDIPYASLIGLGVGYSVRAVLKVVGSGAVASARAMIRGAAAAMEEQHSLGAVPVPAPSNEDDDLIEQLDQVPATPIPPAKQ